MMSTGPGPASFTGLLRYLLLLSIDCYNKVMLSIFPSLLSLTRLNQMLLPCSHPGLLTAGSDLCLEWHWECSALKSRARSVIQAPSYIWTANTGLGSVGVDIAGSCHVPAYLPPVPHTLPARPVGYAPNSFDELMAKQDIICPGVWSAFKSLLCYGLCMCFVVCLF